MTSRECREEANRFAALSLEGGISVRRATILMAIADSWIRLAGQLDRLEALEMHVQTAPYFSSSGWIVPTTSTRLS
jgi:hypothetical protein